MPLCSNSGRPRIWVHLRMVRAVLAQEVQGAYVQLPFLHPGIDMRPGTGVSKNVVAKLLDERDVCSSIDNFLKSPLWSLLPVQ